MTDIENRDAGRRLQNARKTAGLTVEEVATRTGQSVETVRSHEKGARGLTKGKAAKYARLLGIEAEFLLGLSKTPKGIQINPAGGMEVLGAVMAGAFREALEEPVADREMLPIQYDATYADKTQFALRVQGPSMNKIYPDGSYVICVAASDMEARVGDHVVTQRERAGLYEFTLKELCRDSTTQRLYLAPRSHDPRHQAPVELVDGQIEIIAIVIGSYQRRERRGPSAF